MAKLIKSKQPDITVRKNGAISYKITFTDDPVEVSDAVAEDLLKNKNFIEVGSNRKKVDHFEQELMDIDGIGKKTAKDICNVYDHNRTNLIKAISEGKELPFNDDVAEKLSEHYGGKDE